MKNAILILLGLCTTGVAANNIKQFQSIVHNKTSVVEDGKKKISNADIWSNRTFSASSVYGVESMNDGIHFTRLNYSRSGTSVDKYKYETYQKTETIVSSSELKYKDIDVNIDEYKFNATETKLLIAHNQESIYRHSTKSHYFIYDISSKKITPLSNLDASKQRLAEFSPDGEKVAFVRDNNIFIKFLESGEEIQVTHDGLYNNIINGATDWVYEEEFSFDKGFYWSPESDKIAYYKFDESRVKEFQMAMYGTLYPDQYKFKYPKAGEDNSVISINVFDVNRNKTDDFPLGNDSDIYVPRITWSNTGHQLLVQRMNRLQNKLEILVGDFNPYRDFKQTVQPKVVYTEESKTYIDIHDNTQLISGGETILWTSEIDGFNHIYFIDVKSGKLTQITKGDWEVTSVYGADEKSKTIYFQAAKAHATQREIYSVKTDGSNLKKLSISAGTNEAEFSSNFKYFLLYYSNANNPFTVSIHSNFKKSKLKKPLIIEDNANLKKRMQEFDLSQKTFLTIKNNEGTDLNAWMIKPSDFDATKKYPVLMFVYGGPGINTVNDSWSYGNYFWFQSLAQQGYIVVSVDARGTGYRGREFKHCTYQQLGKYETEDQIAAAKNLGKMPYIDKDRIGIFGWSYGGYMSSLCITKGADTFKAAIAVAPVTNWRYYDNVYTERFMRTPQENGENYDINSPINHVDKLKGKYLLIHGSADDNVHFQNAMEMADALIKKNKDFELMAYPNKNHGIYGGVTREHLYNKMTNFLLENL